MTVELESLARAYLEGRLSAPDQERLVRLLQECGEQAGPVLDLLEDHIRLQAHLGPRPDPEQVLADMKAQLTERDPAPPARVESILELTQQKPRPSSSKSTRRAVVRKSALPWILLTVAAAVPIVLAVLLSSHEPPPSRDTDAKLARPAVAPSEDAARAEAARKKAEEDRARAEQARKEAELRLAQLREQEKQAEAARNAALEEELRRKAEQAFADAARKRREEEERLKKSRDAEEEAKRVVEQAPVKPAPAVKPEEKPPTLAAVAKLVHTFGTVAVVGAKGKTPVKAGEGLLEGQGLETVGPKSFATFVYPDGTRVELGANTELKELKADGGKRIHLTRGDIWAVVSKQPKDQPMVVANSHGEATVLGTTLRVLTDPDPKRGLRLEVEEGKVQLKNLSGRTVLVESGNYAVAAVGLPLTAKPLPNLLFADNFDRSPLNQWPQGWPKSDPTRNGFVVLDSSEARGNRYIAVVTAPPTVAQFATIPVNDPAYNLKLSFRVRLGGAANDRTAVEFRDARGVPLSVEYFPQTSTLKVTLGDLNVLKTVNLPILSVAWSEMDVTLSGEHVSVAVNRKTLMEAEAPGYGRCTGATLISRGTDSSHFDDVRVLRLFAGKK